VAREQQIEVTEEDIGLEIAYTAARVQRDPKEVAEQIVSSGQLSALAGDVLRRKSLDHVVASIQVTGRPESSEHDLLAEPADKDQEQELVREDG
jgi:FKBP-type peptidyl-prolyl cis-trans isomerase (trigger factor)